MSAVNPLQSGAVVNGSMSGAHGQQAPWSPCPPGDCSPGLSRTAARNAACATPRWRLGIPGASSRSRSHPADCPPEQPYGECAAGNACAKPGACGPGTWCQLGCGCAVRCFPQGVVTVAGLGAPSAPAALHGTAQPAGVPAPRAPGSSPGPRSGGTVVGSPSSGGGSDAGNPGATPVPVARKGPSTAAAALVNGSGSAGGGSPIRGAEARGAGGGAADSGVAHQAAAPARQPAASGGWAGTWLLGARMQQPVAVARRPAAAVMQP